MINVQPIKSQTAGNEVPVSDYIPLRSHVTEHILTAAGGAYMRSWKVGGISFEAADEADIAVRHDGFNQLLRSIGGNGVAIWSHKVRRKVSDRFSADFPSEFCQELNEKYFDSFAGYRMMANELYITVVYQPASETNALAKFAEKAAVRSPGAFAAKQRDAINYLNDMGHQVESSLKKYDLEPLGTYKKDGILFSSALEFMSFLVNGFWEPVPLRHARINEYLPTSRLFFGNENIEIRTPSSTRYGAIIDFSDYPEFTEPGILNPILYDDFEFVETQSFSMLGKYDAMQALTRQRNQLIASEDVSSYQIAAINTALEEVVNGNFLMGDYHFSLAIFADTLQGVSKNVAKTRSSLQDQGFQTKLVDLVPDAAWFAQLPANWRFRPRAAQLSSRVFCGLSAFHNFASGKRDGNPWGEAVTILKTPSGQPYYVNFHATPDDEDSGDKKALGNTMIVGQSGSGKTVVKLMLLSQASKYDPTMILFDKDRGEELAIRAMGGKYFCIVRGRPTGFNPFKLEPTKSNLMFWIALIKRLVFHPSMPLSPTDEAAITHAVNTVATFDKNKRSITTVRQNLPNTSDDGLNMRLKKWCAGQELGWALDCPEDLQDFSTHKIYGYDYTEFLDDPETRTPLMMYLLFLTESQIDGRRFIYGMAEFWKPLSDEIFSDFVKNKQKTIRKQNGLGVFDTQSPDDVLSSPIARALIEQCSTFIFMANPKATRDDYVNGFKLTDAEYDIISTLGESSRTFLIKQGHHSAVAKLDLAGFEDYMDILSGTTDNVELLDQIRAELDSDDPKLWMPVFRERIATRRQLGKRSAATLASV